MAARRAINFTPMETRREVLVQAAILADRLGYELSGVLSIWGRTAGTIAMNAATLADISGGRYVLGLGASTKALVEGFHGVPFVKPAAQLRRTTKAVRNLLRGERADVPDGLGARTRAVDVAAEVGDGWFPAYVARDTFAGWLPELLEKRVKAAELDTPLTVLTCPTVVVDEDEALARQSAATNLAFYLCAMGDVYARFVASQGYGDAVEAVKKANPKPSPRHGEVPADAEVLMEQLTVYGSADKVREELKLWDAVVDITSLGFPPGTPWPSMEAAIRAGAPEV
jgi:alkanesulfonate monooxygenase SsuD/methylene tetrahydromethanopterin reductase-like flavin-dependent oxidoreductase (luciferase family)